MTLRRLAIEPDESAESDAALDSGSADGSVRLVLQAEQLKNPNVAVTFVAPTTKTLLEKHVSALSGVSTGSLDCFARAFWEVAAIGEQWEFIQSSVDCAQPYGGRCNIIFWEKGKGKLFKYAQSVRHLNHAAQNWQRGMPNWGKSGVCVSKMSDLKASLYDGNAYDENCCAIVPYDYAHNAALWCFCSSADYCREVRKTNQSLLVQTKYMIRIPFDLAHWQKVASEKYPNGLPEPQSDDPTQWLFHGHPAGRVPLTPDPSPYLGSVLQVAVARLLGYRWPAELDDEMRLAPEARAWVDRCKSLHQFVDDDGVVPLVPINKEQPGAERVRLLLEAAFGSKWSPGLLNDLLAAAGSPGKSLDEWIKHDFFGQHCALFHHRPFIWQIWDGRKDGFNILIHYHQLAEGDGKGRKLLEKVTYTYLGDWITQQQHAAKRGEPGADIRLKAAQDLQKKLELIIAGEPPHDLFVRWKPLTEQPIGWNPDINDGVRMNIRPFVTAGILRGKVNVKWKKDRGKEPQSIRPREQFPWFWSCPEDNPPIDFAGGKEFTGERFNDLHYTNECKQQAREK